MRELLNIYYKIAVIFIGIAAFKYIFGIPSETFVTIWTYTYWIALIIGGVALAIYLYKITLPAFVIFGPPFIYVLLWGGLEGTTPTFSEAFENWAKFLGFCILIIGLITLPIGLIQWLKVKREARQMKEKAPPSENPNQDEDE